MRNSTCLRISLLLLLGLLSTSFAIKKISRHSSHNHEHFRDSDEEYSSESEEDSSSEDLCENWWCDKGRECLIVNDKDGEPQPKCICIKKCPEKELKPQKKSKKVGEDLRVCGNDGRYYPSACELYRSGCENNSPNLIIDETRDSCQFDDYNYDDQEEEEYLNDDYNAVQGEIPTSTTVWPSISSKCTQEDYEIYKDNLLLFNHEKLIIGGNDGGRHESDESDEDDDDDEDDEGGFGKWQRINNDQGPNSGRKQKDYLISLMFSHFDSNNNGALEWSELQKIGIEEYEDVKNLQGEGTVLDKNCNLIDLLKFDDSDHDGKVDVNEFYSAFNKLYSISVISLDKALETVHLTANIDDNIELKCDVTGSPPIIPIIWKRFGIDLSTLKFAEDYIRILPDGTLLLNKIQLLHAGNYSCHAQRNEKVIQTHVLKVQTLPDVKVVPHIVWEKPGGQITMECRVTGEPQPSVVWLKNDSPIKPSASESNSNSETELKDKYEVKGDGVYLTIKDIYFSDTGAYMCAGENSAGKRLDITSLVVFDQSPASVTLEQKKAGANDNYFMIFHENGISIHDPSNCRLQHQIQSTDIIPGTQDYVCMEESDRCEWGAAIRVSTYIYASQPKLDRVIVISTKEFVVVDVIPTDRYPVELHYVEHLDQVWVECWRREKFSLDNSDSEDPDTDDPLESSPDGEKTLLVIREAKEKKKHHHTVHPEPIDSHFDLVQKLFLPTSISPFANQFRYGYVSHKNVRGLYKMDLIALRYIKSIDLSPYNCYPQELQFSTLYGMIFIECIEPVTLKPTGQVVLDALTDAVTFFKKSDKIGRSFISPDSRKLISLTHSRGTTLLVQNLKENGELEFAFDVKTSLNVSDLTFFPSQDLHSFDLFAVSSKEDVLYLDLASGKVEIISGIGGVVPRKLRHSEVVGQISSQNRFFSQFLATISFSPLSSTNYNYNSNSNASNNKIVYILNGLTRTINCQISSGLNHPKLIVWI